MYSSITEKIFIRSEDAIPGEAATPLNIMLIFIVTRKFRNPTPLVQPQDVVSTEDGFECLNLGSDVCWAVLWG
jgi:hypothetical protein